MFFSLDDIVAWLGHYKYVVIFPFAVFEGPIITIISGFLSSLGQLNFWLAYAVVTAADLVGDSIYYCIGRFGGERFIRRFGKYLGLDLKRVERLEHYFKTHPWKLFTIGKVVHGTGSLILVSSGLGKVPYFRFLGYNIPTALLNSFALIVIGFYFGQAYENFNTYFKYVGSTVLILLIIAYIYFLKRTKKSLDV